MSEQDYEQLTWFREDFLANHLVLPGSDAARKMTAISGRKCLELSRSCAPLLLLEKMLLDSLVWGSTERYLTWKVRGTQQGRLYFQLVPSVPNTNENALPLLPTLTKADTYRCDMKSVQAQPGSRHSLTIVQAFRWEMWPTLTASEKNGVEKNRFRGNKNYPAGKVASIFRASSDDLTHINPDYAEAYMGFPTGWTELEH